MRKHLIMVLIVVALFIPNVTADMPVVYAESTSDNDAGTTTPDTGTTTPDSGTTTPDAGTTTPDKETATGNNTVTGGGSTATGNNTVIGGGSTATGNNTVIISPSGGSSSAEAEEDSVADEIVTSLGAVIESKTPISVTGGVTAAAITTETGDIKAAVGGVKAGEYVNVSVLNSQCGPEAKKAVTNAASSLGADIAAILDIYVDVVDSKGVPSRNVTDLSAPIEFKVTAPENIDGNVYDFAVLRLHNGKVDVLPDIDNDPTTITFKTDKFSVYALVYDQKGAFDNIKVKDNVLKTGDTTIPVWPLASVGIVAGIAAVVLRKKEQA